MTFKIPEYDVIRQDRPDQAWGGVAFIIKRDLKYSQLDNTTISQEHLIVKINNIIFVGMYNHPLNVLSKHELTKIMSLGNRVMLLGDLNSKHQHWDANCTVSNTSGRNLDEFAEREDYIIHYPEEPTYFPFNGNTPSTLDIAVTKNIPNVDNVRTISTMTSDHDPVYLEIKHKSAIPRLQGQFHDYKTTNWKKIQDNTRRKHNNNKRNK